MAGADREAPPAATVAVLQQLTAAGRPVSYQVYPDTDHGILRFRVDAAGERQPIGYHPDYFRDQVRWLQQRLSAQAMP